ncbi:hypothetical protein MK079_05320 [Candidatus Gracilibacteria bacterium]|nr:hypothetical protein [Candidatus Gracilibacteria bacterium]
MIVCFLIVFFFIACNTELLWIGIITPSPLEIIMIPFLIFGIICFLTINNPNNQKWIDVVIYLVTFGVLSLLAYLGIGFYNIVDLYYLIQDIDGIVNTEVRVNFSIYVLLFSLTIFVPMIDISLTKRVNDSYNEGSRDTKNKSISKMKKIIKDGEHAGAAIVSL